MSEFRWPKQSGGGTWGSITGTLSDQTDLQNALNAKADQATTYTKTEVDNALSAKADQATTYTKTEVDNALNAKQDSLPSQTGNNGKVLGTDGTDLSWVTPSGGGTWGSITGTLSSQTDLQSALNAKQATITGAATSIVSSNLTTSRALVSDASGKVSASSVTSTQLGYVSGVTSSIQTQLNSKQATITGAATSIVSSNLTASRALVSDSSGKVDSSVVTSTELGYISGVTSSIQTQLNSKLPTTITATGDLIYSSSGTTASRLPIGSSNQVLTVSGGVPSWKNPMSLPDQSVASTALSWNHATQYKDISANTAFTWTAPTAGSVTMSFIVKNTSGTDVTITLPAGIVKRTDFTLVVKAGKINAYTFMYSQAYNKVVGAVVQDMEE